MHQDKYSSSGSCFGIWFLLFLIPSLFVFFLLLGYYDVISFGVNIHTVVTILVIFVIYIFFIKHNARYVACKVGLSSRDMEKSLKDALEDNGLTIMDDTKSTLNIRDFLHSYFKGIRDDNYAKVASSVFPMLGILGTFIAIAISMPDFSASSSQNLDREISLLLSGIGTAFYASIYGIFLSLWWTFFERMGLSKIEQRSLGLEKMYGEYIWSESELTKHEHMQAQLKDKKLIQALRETFNLDLIKEMSSQNIHGYKSIMSETSEQFIKVTEHMNDASSRLRQTAELIDTKEEGLLASSKLSDDIANFVEGVEHLNRGLDRFNNDVDRTFDKIDEELAAAVNKLGEITELIVTSKYKEL